MLKKEQQENRVETRIYEVLKDHVPEKAISKRNKAKAWKYGYDEDFDVVVISKDGTIGEVYEIQGLKVALPSVPDSVYERSSKKKDQYWEPFEYHDELKRIPNIEKWNEAPMEFKREWVPYINQEFDRREQGFWFKNNGKDTYITGSNYMYLQWSFIDVGLPDFREANRILWLFWEACKADNRCFGMCYLKIRRSGASFMGASEATNIGTLARNSKLGILSKTGEDAKSLFTDKLVPISQAYPFFFKPLQAGMDKPRTELLYQVPASKLTKKNMFNESTVQIKGLNTTINWKSTGNNAYDSEKLIYLLHDESGKWKKPHDIEKNFRVTKTCLRLGRKIIGKCFMVSTSNELKEGGSGFKKIYEDSSISTRNKNGQTKSGLYSLYIPTEWNLEGYIDIYGMPVQYTPKKPVMGIDGDMIYLGAIDWWENEEEAKKGDPDDLNEFYRQYSRTEAHAFRDASNKSLFNLTKIYEQIDYNDAFITKQQIQRGSFHWVDGKKDGKVVFTPDKQSGRFLVSWIPPKHMQNSQEIVRGRKSPGNKDIGSFGCDSYDISGTVGGGGSKGALHCLTKTNMDPKAPNNKFVLEYIARPQTAEIFYEDVLKAIVFYGMPVLVENNKPRLLYHLKNRGYRLYSMDRPDKDRSKLSITERELGGMPNTSTEVKLAHSEAIEHYIDKYVGLNETGEMGDMPFNRTLNDWAGFDINNRTSYDASISSGLAIMANLRHLYKPIEKKSKISINFARYNNDGVLSKIET